MSDLTLTAADIQSSTDLIQPFNDSNLKAVSYDVSVGRHVFLLGPLDRGGRQDKFLHGSQDSVKIPPGWSAVVESEERLRLPDDVYARMTSRTSWTLKQLLVSGGLIDPGFEGELWIPVRNTSQRPVELHRHSRIATVVFVRTTHSEPDGYRGPRRDLDHIKEWLDGSLADTHVSVGELSEDVGRLRSRIKDLERRLSTQREVLNAAIAEEVARRTGDLGGRLAVVEPRVDASWAVLKTVLFAAIAATVGASLFWMAQEVNASGATRIWLAGLLLLLIVAGVVVAMTRWSRSG